jgi:flagellin-like protein
VTRSGETPVFALAVAVAVAVAVAFAFAFAFAFALSLAFLVVIPEGDLLLPLPFLCEPSATSAFSVNPDSRDTGAQHKQ